MMEQLEISNSARLNETSTDKIGVLLCHGFLSKHEQMVPLSNYIYETLGWETSLVELTGHGYDQENIATATWNNWVDDVKEKYLSLRKRCDKVYMIGFSLGGCISAYVASLKSIRPEGLIIVNGVFGVKNVFNKLLPGVMIYNKVCSKVKLQKIMLESITNDSEDPELNQPLVNLSATNELRKMSKIAGTILQDVKCPTFVIQEYNDPTVFYGSGKRAFKKLGATFKRFYTTKLNTHLTIHDKGLECSVFCKILEFLKDVEKDDFVNIAHRGASGDFTENTLQAFEEAIDRGCNAIEFDVQSIGNHFRIFHDRDFHRMFGIDIETNKISETEVSKLVYPNLEKLPTLQEALDCINGRVDVNIEIKSNQVAVNIANIAESYLEKPEWKNKSITLSCFSLATINTLYRFRKKAKLSYLLYDQYCNLEEIKRLKDDYIKYNIHSLNLPLESISEKIIEYCVNNNIRIYVYTVNEIKQIRYLRELGVNGVFTDYPRLIR
jgi:glycerophosphoryl diester phosphodiesterase